MTSQPSPSKAVLEFVSVLESQPGRAKSDLGRSTRIVQDVRPGAFVYPEILPDALRCMVWGREYQKSCNLVLDIVQQNPKEPVLNRVQAAVYVGYYNLPKDGNATGGHPRDVSMANRAAGIVADILDKPDQKLSPKWRVSGEMMIAWTFGDKTPRGREACRRMKLLLRTNPGEIGAMESGLAAQFLDERQAKAGHPGTAPAPISTPQMASPTPPVQAGPRPLAVVIPFRALAQKPGANLPHRG